VVQIGIALMVEQATAGIGGAALEHAVGDARRRIRVEHATTRYLPPGDRSIVVEVVPGRERVSYREALDADVA